MWPFDVLLRWLGHIRRELRGRCRSAVVGLDVDQGWLTRGEGPLKGWPDLTWVHDILAVATERLGHLVVTGEAQIAARLRKPALRVGRPTAVQADHAYDVDLVPCCRVHFHGVQAERTIAMKHQHLLVRVGHLDTQAERQADTHGPPRPRVQTVAR